MTKLSELPNGRLRMLEDRLEIAGFTAEHAEALLADDPRLRRWLVMLDENVEPEPPLTRVPIEAAFGGKGSIMHKLLRMEFLYLDEVVKLTEREFLNIPGFGPTALRKAKGVLLQHGLKFSETYSEPSVLVYDDRQWRYYYRPRIMNVQLSWLVSIDYDDWIDRGQDDMTLGGFAMMSDEQQTQVLNEKGIARVKALIARFQL